MGLDDMILFWMLSFKPTFSVSSFTFNKRLFSSSYLSAIRFMSCAYLRLLIFLIFLVAIWTSACASLSLAFRIMYFAYKLNKQGDNIQPWCSPFFIWNQLLFCVWFFLTCIQSSQEAGQVVWYSHLLKNFPQFSVIPTLKGFTIVNESPLSKRRPVISLAQ